MILSAGKPERDAVPSDGKPQEHDPNRPSLGFAYKSDNRDEIVGQGRFTDFKFCINDKLGEICYDTRDPEFWEIAADVFEEYPQLREFMEPGDPN